MTQKALFEIIGRLTTQQGEALSLLERSANLQTEIASSNVLREAVLNEHEGRIHALEGRNPGHDERTVRAWVKVAIAEYREPWWQGVLKTAGGILLGTIGVSLVLFFSGHLHIAYK